MAKIMRNKVNKLKKESQFGVVMSRIMKNPTAATGLIIFLILVILSILAPVLTPYKYSQMDMTATFQSPSWQHFCGTDNLGPDIFTRLLYGGRYSLNMGFIAMFAAATVGVII